VLGDLGEPLSIGTFGAAIERAPGGPVVVEETVGEILEFAEGHG
jgi:hypothetical protein